MWLPKEVRESFLRLAQIMHLKPVVPAGIAQREEEYPAFELHNKIRKVHPILAAQLVGAHRVGLHTQPTHAHPQGPIRLVAEPAAAHTAARAVGESKGPPYVGGEALVKAKGQQRVVMVPAEDAAVHRNAMQMRFPETQGRIQRVADLLHTERLVAEVAFELLEPKHVIRGNEMVEVLINHLQQNQGACMALQVGKDDLPWKVLA